MKPFRLAAYQDILPLFDPLTSQHIVVKTGADDVQGPGTGLSVWWVLGERIIKVKFLTCQYMSNDLTWHPLSVMSCLELPF